MAEEIKDEKKFVVVINGQRASQTMTESEAHTEAKKRQTQTNENQSAKTPAVQVKQNLCG